MQTHAIALDMDGTLLDPSGEISYELVQLLYQMQKEGTRVFLATGRTHQEIQDVLPENFHPDGVVSANGMDCTKKEKTLVKHQLDEQLTQEMITLARQQGLYYEIHHFDNNRYAYFFDQRNFFNELKKTRPVTLLQNEFISRTRAIQNDITWIENVPGGGIVKLYFFSMDQNKMDAWKAALDQMKAEKAFSTYSSSVHNVEITVADVSKATGIQLLMDAYRLNSKNLLAVGDSENDLPIFDLAATSVVMKNADNHVKSYADLTTAFSYEQNGLYYFLKDFFG